MKKQLIFINLVLLTFFIGCKNKEEVAPVEEVKANTFDVIVDLQIQKDDELILFYKDPSIAYFDDKNTVYNGVKGNIEPQSLTFSVPEGVLPNDIRFDISSKKDQDPITINAITLSFEGRTFKILKGDILKYFTPNEFIKFDEATGIVTFIKNGENFDPYFLTKPAIYPEIEKVRGAQL
ncbi:hypothetical protein [Flavobacterium sp.]|uniref:hypothetical protein n=1 Tax=Flavobacterium sp. TaxID=239 RepID=UPI0025C1D2B0|nr:hypothetical protein [Flavobacterium sp.]